MKQMTDTLEANQSHSPAPSHLVIQKIRSVFRITGRRLSIHIFPLFCRKKIGFSSKNFGFTSKKELIQYDDDDDDDDDDDYYYYYYY